MKWEEFRNTGIMQEHTKSMGRKPVRVYVEWKSKKYGKGSGFLDFSGLGMYNRLMLYDGLGFYCIPLYEIKKIKMMGDKSV
jgi:hypothetical protein